MDDNKKIKDLYDDIKKIEVYKDILESRISYENGEYEDFDDALDDITRKYGWDDAINFDISQMIKSQLEKSYLGKRSKELLERLINVPDSYQGFIAGIMRYASTGEDREEKVISYLDSHTNSNCTDITKFVIDQPDFHEAARQTYLERRLYELEDVYPDFVEEVLLYVSRKSGRVDVILNYLNDNKDVKTSDVLELISN